MATRPATARALARAALRPAVQSRCAQISAWYNARSTDTSSAPIRTFSTSTPRRDAADKSTHFGYETVSEKEKTERVAGVFTSVADTYDKMNDLMSFGWHRVWKDHFVSSLNPISPSSPSSPVHILDIAGGTGDIAFRHLRHAAANSPSSFSTLSATSDTSSPGTNPSAPPIRVTISDINPSMLAVGQQRAKETLPPSQQSCLSFLEANAEDLASAGIPDNSVDLYTVAFGIRNFTNIPLALREAYRVLKPGGVFACLEFSKVSLPGNNTSTLGTLATSLFDGVYKRWSFGAIPLIGHVVAGDRDSYQYLVESIERFPDQRTFRDMIVDAGFEVAGGKEGDGGWENLTGGVAAIHKGMKPLR